MDIEQILDIYKNSTQAKSLSDKLEEGATVVEVGETVGSGLSVIIANIFKEKQRQMLVVCSDRQEAAYMLNDLERFLTKDKVLFFPSSYAKAYEVMQMQNSNVLLRAEVLSKVMDGENENVVVTYTEAIFEKVLTQKVLKKNIFAISVEQHISIEELREKLSQYAFQVVDFVTSPGQYSIRGGIVDVFSYSCDMPLRIEFFANQIESIRTFDIETQLSVEKLKKADIIPNIEDKNIFEQRNNIFQTIDKQTIVVTKDYDLFADKLNSMYQKACDKYQNTETLIEKKPPQELFCNWREIEKSIEEFTRVNVVLGKSEKGVNFSQHPQPPFNKNFKLLTDHLREKYNEGFTNYIFCVSEQQAKKMEDIFSELHTDTPCAMMVCPIYMGFTDLRNKINIYSDHQILDRYYKFNVKNGYEKKQSITLKELNQLKVGDYVTHIDHGIGRFAGLETVQVAGRQQEAIKLIYGERDVLYVGIYSLHKIAKYNAKEGVEPKIYRLGSSAWKTLKQKTKTKVKEIAFNLITLYAKRKQAVGFACGSDSLLQKELEASFLYEDTPDQSRATQEVKADMESTKPMDRLVCGDVGFGKTEVAIRAAFKAVDNSKQVAVLVPTTVLAFQHYKTFAQRMKQMPVEIQYLNRFRTATEKKQILKDVENGKIDIIIATHQIVGKNVKFKNLGLLIVDEEQKFGVAVKDKLKTLRENLDVLTLTATPIPRTLQFSLMAARDLSIIKTPPPNRYPIESSIIQFDPEIIRDAIVFEMQRDGQVFFIHNRVENIAEVAGIIQNLVPDAKIAVGHGQMDGKKLEGIMLDFMEGKYDILVATTIIENGFDVPNANTIFVHNAQNFGLSDLHQIRGRVGRGNKKSFCYFITPPLSSMGKDARGRMEAIAQFSDLGSGINIAMKDLEIRGAGDLLGAEQSGFISDIGFETYQKILQEAIEELKKEDFADLYRQENEKREFRADTTLESDFQTLFPQKYISSMTERLNLYSRLSEISNNEDLKEYERELVDRFGKIPPETKDLLNSVRIKQIASKMGIERLVLKQNKMIGYFVSDPQSEFYNSNLFNQRVMNFIKENNKRCLLQQKTYNAVPQLVISFKDVKSVSDALEILSGFEK